MKPGFRCLLLSAFAAATPALAAPTTEAQLRTTAEQWLRQHYAQPGSRVEVHAGPLDSHLHLPECDGSFSISLPANARPAPRMSVPVRCTTGTRWMLRVPVQLKIYRQVLVASRPLIRGDGIVAADVHREERDITRLGYGYIETLDQIAERTLARPLRAGSALTPSALGGRHMVRAGDHVQLIAELAGISVRADGIALGSGDSGARLRVRNDSSGRVVDALVRSPGVVVALP